jgi:hypothetical protein
LLPASGQEISISLLSSADISQYLSGIIEAGLSGPGRETAVGRDTEPTAELRRNIAERTVYIGSGLSIGHLRIYALRRCGKAGISFLSNL